MRVPRETYELTAMFMRYWFVFLGLVITLRAFRWLVNDRRSYQMILAALPDAGLIGEVVDLNTGASFPLPREGIISGRSYADIRLKKLKYQSIAFQFVENKGVRLSGHGRNRSMLLEGEPLRRNQYALHGSRFVLPPYELRFRLFAGLDVPQRRPAELARREVHAEPMTPEEAVWPPIDVYADDYAYDYAYDPVLDATWPYAPGMDDAFTDARNYENDPLPEPRGDPEIYDGWGNTNGED